MIRLPFILFLLLCSSFVQARFNYGVSLLYYGQCNASALGPYVEYRADRGKVGLKLLHVSSHRAVFSNSLFAPILEFRGQVFQFTHYPINMELSAGAGYCFGSLVSSGFLAECLFHTSINLSRTFSIRFSLGKAFQPSSSPLFIPVMWGTVLAFSLDWRF